MEPYSVYYILQSVWIFKIGTHEGTCNKSLAAVRGDLLQGQSRVVTRCFGENGRRPLRALGDSSKKKALHFEGAGTVYKILSQWLRILVCFFLSPVNVTAWFNNQAYHSIAVSVAAVDTAILRSTLGKNFSLTTINHPLPRTAQESINDLKR